MLSAGATRGLAQAVISGDFENPNVNSVTYSGVEPQAQSANAAFGAANLWNSIQLGYLSPLVNPSFASLFDSTGATTSVGLTFTGTVDSYSSSDGSSPNNICKEFIYLNSGSLDWQITGLAPNTAAAMYLYNYGNPSQSYRTFDMLVDKDGNGSLETTVTVDAVNNAYVSGIQTSPTGTIYGRMQHTGGQSSWSGFQLQAQVPEPSTIVAAVVGMVVIAARREAGSHKQDMLARC